MGKAGRGHVSPSGSGRGAGPPRDPRDGWKLPALGTLPRTARLDELTTRVLAPNPSAMTLDGTNTYVVGRDGHGAIVVDPGPDDREHLEGVRAVMAERDLDVTMIFVTHRHIDHAAAAPAWAVAFRCPVVAADRRVAGDSGRLVGDGDRLTISGAGSCDVVATPGHTDDHLGLRLPDGTMLVGDHVLGRGTSVVAHPDGNMEAYLVSLRKVLELDPHALYPGHGPALTEDVGAVVSYYLAHRRFRHDQILGALGADAVDLDTLVAGIYPDLDEHLRPAAASSTRAMLAVMETRGEIERVGPSSDPPRYARAQR